MPPWIIWIIGALVGLVLEMIVPAWVFGGLGVAAFFTALVAALGASVALQLAVWALLGVVFVVPLRRLMPRKPGPRGNVR